MGGSTTYTMGDVFCLPVHDVIHKDRRTVIPSSRAIQGENACYVVAGLFQP